jgi:hypothetical protein
VGIPDQEERPADAAARRLRRQAVACHQLGSPLYGGLLDHAADDLLAGGPTAAVLDGHVASPWRTALALRMLGGVHALVLTGQAPDGECLVTLTTWPGGHQRVLGTAPPHGLPVTWESPGSARSG